MTMRLTRRGRIVLGVAAGALAIAVGAATAALTNSIDATSAEVAGAPVPTQVAPTPTGSTAPSGTPAGSAGRGTTAWRVAAADQASSGQIAGYAQPFVHPGQPIRLHVSTAAASFRVVAYRIGYYQGKGATRVARLGPLRGHRGSAATSAPRTGAISVDWPVATTIPTDNWEPGLYLLALTTQVAQPKTYTVPVVVASSSATGRVLLVAGDTTWQAYNTWGGKSAYQGPDGNFASRSLAVSFDRPYNWSGYRWPAAFDIPLIRLADKLGLPLAYGSVTSITADPGSVTGALGIVSNGHDEYWTPQYRDALVKARDMGTNLAFMGANAGYWKTRMTGTTAQMPKGATMQRWRDDPEAVAENAITGQVYDCFPARADMVIRDPRFFLFEGTRVRRGTTITNLVGAETDRVYPLGSTPRPIQIPTLTRLSCNGAKTYATMAYYTTPSGAGVFATGTMDWVRAMGGPRGDQGLGDDALRFTRAVTANLLRAMAAGPMGKSHPAGDELDEVDLPSMSTTNVTLGTLDR